MENCLGKNTLPPLKTSFCPLSAEQAPRAPWVVEAPSRPCCCCRLVRACWMLWGRRTELALRASLAGKVSLVLWWSEVVCIALSPIAQPSSQAQYVFSRYIKTWGQLYTRHGCCFFNDHSPPTSPIVSSVLPSTFHPTDTSDSDESFLINKSCLLGQMLVGAGLRRREVAKTRTPTVFPQRRVEG